MNFLKNRVLPFFLVMSILVSFCVVPAHAVGTMREDYLDDAEVAHWNAVISNPGLAVVDLLPGPLGLNASASYYDIFWSFVNRVVMSRIGPVGQGELDDICSHYNTCFNRPMGENFFQQLFQGTADVLSNSLSLLFFMGMDLHFVVEKHPVSDLYRIKEANTGLWVVSSSGAYPYVDYTETGVQGSDVWILRSEAIASDKHLTDYDRLCSLSERVGGTVGVLGNFYVIFDKLPAEYVYADSDRHAYCAPYNKDSWASNTDRDDTVVKDENGEVIEDLPIDNSTNIDLSGLTMTLPNGTIMMVDQIVYDESTKTYHVDSHDVYNYTTYNYYTWNYYINYTSITYIGQTEEYNKYYEVYYELPDGRDSADLTVEELEQLNVSIDVIPYSRSADDTSLRSLYHFDGDTRDSSFWNNQTYFLWEDGASLTYMDAGVFNGALYLDETFHRFMMQLPSNIGSQDFTMQFRYYQSYTAAPQTDSYIEIGSTKVLQFDGANLKTGAGTVWATLPIGTWNEICIMRKNGSISYWLNGVYCTSVSNVTAFGPRISFEFGADQQTYKYLDEFRFVDQALYKPSYFGTYECTAVPYDTNLILVLPDSQVPVADEYWDISFSSAAVQKWDFTSGTQPYFFDFGSVVATTTDCFPSWVAEESDVFFGPNFTSLSGDMSSRIYSATPTNEHHLEQGEYTLSILFQDGSISSATFDSSLYSTSTLSNKDVVLAEFAWGVVTFDFNKRSTTLPADWFLLISPTSPVDLVAMELVPGTGSSLSAEWIESVQGLDRDSLNTPTLAVKTDIPITSYQIGGVRPSLPTKGLVWALVEAGYMRSLQIYTGTAWEGVDGRIWTGERWIPYSSYNVITLQDMYDIVDATQDYEYIYSESGFWSWWQKSWNAFTEKLFSVLGVSSGDGTTPGVDLDAEDPVMDPTTEDDASLWQFVLLVVAGGKAVVGGVRHLFSGVVSTIPDTVDDLTGAFEPGGIAVGALDGTSLDPDAADLFSVDESEVLDPWRYR